MLKSFFALFRAASVLHSRKTELAYVELRGNETKNRQRFTWFKLGWRLTSSNNAQPHMIIPQRWLIREPLAHVSVVN